MDIHHTPEEAKKAIVQETIFEVFNPFSALGKENQSVRQDRSVISYTVQSGDTLSGIASRYGISLDQLIEENKINNPHMVGIGMKLVVTSNIMTHVVTKGETLDSITHRFQVDKETLIERNPLLKILPDHLYIGQKLTIPRPQAKPVLSGNVQMRRQMTNAASRSMSRSRAMDWPIEKPTVTSTFGMRWGKMHKGLDLWNEERDKTPILAAKAGKVIEAGAHRSGYGYMVVLDHGDGLQTFYAHMRKIKVSVGQNVHYGDILGYMGKSGDSTDYHLHFEVRQDDVPMNPMRYLRK